MRHVKNDGIMIENMTIVARERTAWLQELRAISALGWPIVLTNVAQLAMGTTDVMMMGWLGPETLAAGALGTNLYFIAMIFGIGLLNATAPLIARTLGGNPHNTEDVRRTVQQSLWTAAILAVPCWFILWWSASILRAMGQDPALAAAAGTYLRALQWALLPFWSYLVLRSFMSALERPGWSLVIGLAAVAFNAAANWCLMLGHCGFKPMGIVGSGIATLSSSVLMFLALAVVICADSQFRIFRLFDGYWRRDWSRFKDIWRLGLPMAGTLSFEVTIFNAAVFLMGLIGAASLAGHSIAIQIAATTFMVPLGIGHAATIRVGRAFGMGDVDAIRRAGWTAFALAMVFMSATSVMMITAPRLLISAFLDTHNPENARVVELAISFLAVAALFQIADGAQAVGSGMLRGLHDARVPMLFALAGYWGIGLPLGVILAFPLGFGGIGIWIGLAAGLSCVAILMMRRWMRREEVGLLVFGVLPSHKP